MAKKAAAKAAPGSALAVRDPSSLEPWEKELEAEAARSKEAVAGVAGGHAVSIRGGKLKVGGEEVPSGEIAVCILAHTGVKTYYDNPQFDPDQPVSPACFAFGAKISDMKPHPEASKPQCDGCAACRWNEFGTSETGRKKGKRCKDAIRLAFVQGGTLTDGGYEKPDAAMLQTSETYTMSVPATSMKACAAYVRSVADAARRPLYGVFTRIKVEPDERVQVKVSFDCLGLVPKEQIQLVRSRVASAEDVVKQPFPKASAVEEKKPAKKGKSKF